MNWIDIKTQIPPNRTKVLALFKVKFLGMDPEMVIKICLYDYEDGFNLKEERDAFNSKIEYKVTHWMLLPEFPKE